MNQTTIRRAVSLVGTGLHSGETCELRLGPLGADAGIQVLRSDVPSAEPFRAHPDRVSETTRCTALRGDGGESVRTVEHLFAAIAGLGIDNVLVSVNAAEVPLADGSSRSFVSLLDDAGRADLPAPASIRRVDGAYYAQSGERLVAAFPYDGLKITCIFVDEHGGLGVQCFDHCVDGAVFREQISDARTIGFLHEVEALRARGLALGADMDQAIVIDRGRYVNEPRFADEPVRHKVLDLLGDMAALGQIRGHLVSVRGGHALNNALARQLSALVPRHA